ncbi:MAG: hypothetical protein J6Y54_07000 [Lentisphaeria bacterium]|nr:hypothetical protein [Lentisphaeria bacterium]
MNIDISIGRTLRGALIAAICGTAALTARADTSWMILPKAATNGLMLMHINRDASKANPVPKLIYDARKQYGGKYKFLRICSNDFCIAGINEKGLGVIYSGGDPTSDKNPPKSNKIFNAHNATVIMLRHDASADLAVRRLHNAFKNKLISGSAIYFIADPYRAFVVECSPKHFASWELPHAFCVYTHCWKLPGMDDGSIGTADRAQWNYQREWAAREFLRLAMEKNKGMIPITESAAVSRLTAHETGKKTVLNGPSSKTTFAAFTLELDPEYPDYLSTVYASFGPPRHTLYLPVPFIAADKLPAEILSRQAWEAALKRKSEAAEDAAVDPALVELQDKILFEYNKKRTKARSLLRSDRNAEAEKLLRETMRTQADEIAAFLNKASQTESK